MITTVISSSIRVNPRAVRDWYVRRRIIAPE
jgi:hypothetical protein